MEGSCLAYEVSRSGSDVGVRLGVVSTHFFRLEAEIWGT